MRNQATTTPAGTSATDAEEKPGRGSRRRPVTRAAARGVIASMAMSGLRRVTTTIGLVSETPPEAVLERTAPEMLRRLPKERRPALVEMVHWTYGAAGGALYGLLPRAVRRQPWAGPLYGLLFWEAFERGLAPALGLSQPRSTGERLALLADHLLYGSVVGASPWPHEDR
ncbi:hypothetical protein [Nonomuraea sp. NPDC050783]|uniref:hypothetical protein n=1 Tax=Nonomuraea sp. NPDC050783 TaxID=3154634 RepID=UPI003466D7E2